MKTTVKVAFGDIKFGKKTTIAIEIKGSLSDEQKLSLLEFANSDGFVTLASAQSDITDYGVTAHRGIKATIDNGNISVDPDQLDMDEIIKDDTEPGDTIPEDSEPDQEEEKEEEEEQQQDPEIKMMSAVVLMSFKYQGDELKKGTVIKIPEDQIDMFVNNNLVKLVEVDLDDELPF